MKQWLLAAACAFLAVFRVAAGGDLEVYDQTQEITYNPDVGLEINGSVEVFHNGDAVSFFVTISSGRSGTFAYRLLSTGTDDLTYQLYNDPVSRTVVKDLTTSPSDTEVLWGSAPTNSGWLPQRVDVPFVLEIPAGRLLGSGTYSDSLTVSVYTGSPASPTLQSNATLTVSGPVANSISLALVDPGASYPLFGAQTDRAMDFGELLPGLQSALDLLVEANCAFSVALDSANGGALANTDPADSATIPYTLEFASAVVDLSGGNPVQVATSPGFRYPIVVTIGDLGFASSGTYEDVVTITVTAQ